MAEWVQAEKEWEAFGTHVYESPNLIERDGKYVRDRIQIDDICYPDRYNKMPANQLFWTGRWSDQLNYRYWKQRAQAESTAKGVEARRLFYEGTLAYKTGDFPTAADKFKEGLNVWKKALAPYPTYRDDELNKKDTGLIVKRYTMALKQNLAPIPDDLPFKECLRLVAHDNTVDPFAAIEMLGVTSESRPPPATSGTPPSGGVPASSGN
jgi:hypothetical protein